MPRPVPTLCALALLAALGPAGAARADDFDTLFVRYKQEIQRPALIKRTLARRRLADTYDPRALEVLVGEYRRPEQPRQQVRYLITQLATESFGEPQFLPTLREWRTRHDRPEDAWLWYQTLSIPIDEVGVDEPLSVARDDAHGPFLRAAALEALRWRRAPGVLEALPGLLGDLPRDREDRAVLLESVASVLGAYDERRSDASIVPAFEGICAALEDGDTPDRTRVVCARKFHDLLRVPYHWREPGKWLQELRIAQGGGKATVDDRYAGGPTFAGLEATGDRIVYVIDWSDSMLEPLTAAERENLPKGPISGSNARRRAKEESSRRWRRAFEAVRWGEVTNRFEAARELLKASLLQLEEEQSFAVIGFGDEANTLRCTSGLTRASIGNIQRAFKELDAIRPGPSRDNRPHGTLGGKTNLHGGLMLAFRLTNGRPAGDGEYVDWETFEEGCDTVFVLSDGDPTWDNWASEDRKDVGDQAGDPEMGGRTADSDMLNFPGPYARGYFLVTDVKRLNLFRHAEIHCVGMGEANMSLLQSLAGIGRGEAISLRRGPD